MFYLIIHSTHFIYSYLASDMVQNHSARDETRCHQNMCVFRLAARDLLYVPSLRIAFSMTFGISVVEHKLEWEIDQWVHHEGSIRQSIAP